MKIFITGSSSGLGLALAREYLEAGAEVWGIGRRESAINGEQNFRYSRCDTSDREAVFTVFTGMINAGFIPDAMVFCAGSATDDIADRTFSVQKFRENFDLNLFGVFYWVELFMPYFLQRGSGAMAAVSSMSVYLENHRRRIGYSASRAALNKAFENLRLEYLDSGVNFAVFSMGRMKERSDFIGTSYPKASQAIIKKLAGGECSGIFHIPFSQFLLTRAVSLVPKKIFRKHLMS